MSEYRVALDVYNGPLDLLLFLIRREEIDIQDIPIAEVTRQYVEYVQLLQQIDPESAGEFLVLAATLMEIKSRMLLPRPPEESAEEAFEDPRSELVRQLLLYKSFKDSARLLEHAAEEQSMKFPRQPVLPEETRDEIDLEGIDIWDLFRAFKHLLEQVGQAGPVHRVQVDDTPIALHADDILDSLQRAEGVQKFDAVFAGRTRAEMIGLFLALLELIRQRRIRVSQDRLFGEILIHLLDATPLTSVADEAYSYPTETNELVTEASMPSADVLGPWDQGEDSALDRATESLLYNRAEGVDDEDHDASDVGQMNTVRLNDGDSAEVVAFDLEKPGGQAPRETDHETL